MESPLAYCLNKKLHTKETLESMALSFTEGGFLYEQILHHKRGTLPRYKRPIEKLISALKPFSEKEIKDYLNLVRDELKNAANQV